MASESDRLRLHAPSGGDPADVPADMGRLRDQLDEQVVVYDLGPLSTRPAAGVEGRLFYATDVGQLFVDIGTGWVPSAWSPGDLRWSAATGAPPVGWLVCDGSAVSRTTYAALFAAIGTAWGAGNGSTTFNLPPANRVPIGATSARPVGSTGGQESVSLTVGQLPSHTHAATVASAGAHSHGGSTAPAGDHAHLAGGRNSASVGGGTTFNYVDWGIAFNHPTTNSGNHAHSIAVDGAHTHSVSIGATGSGQPHSIMQPWMAAQLLIKT